MKRKKSFKHASNLRTQAAMMRLRIALGPAGYGLYFMLAEQIYQFGKPLRPDDFDILAYELHATEADIRAVVCNFGLFTETPDGYILPVEQASQPATPSDMSDMSDKPDLSAPPPLEDLVDQLAANDDLMDDLTDEVGPPQALTHIIDTIIADCPPVTDIDSLVKLVRARIREYLIDHPKPVYKRREWMG